MQISSESIQKQIPYYLSQESKDNLVKALDSFPRSIQYYINKYPADVLQGDGWNSLEIIRFEDGERGLIKGIILTNSCDIDSNNIRVMPPKLSFAPLISLDVFIGFLEKAGLEVKQISDKITAIKEQKVSSLFYLPKSKGIDVDSVALLEDVHSIPFTSFNARHDKQKLFTLSDVGFYLFLMKLSIHFCRFHEDIARSD